MRKTVPVHPGHLRIRWAELGETLPTYVGGLWVGCRARLGGWVTLSRLTSGASAHGPERRCMRLLTRENDESESIGQLVVQPVCKTGACGRWGFDSLSAHSTPLARAAGPMGRRLICTQVIPGSTPRRSTEDERKVARYWFAGSAC